MRCTTGLLSITACFLLGWQTVSDATPCITAETGIDVAHHTVSIELVLPPGVDSIVLAPFDGYRRDDVLHSPDGSAIFAGDKLRPADPHQRHLRLDMDVRANLPQRDRAYAPFLRFADGTVAVDSDILAAAPGTTPLCLDFTPAAGQEVAGFGSVSDKPLRVPLGAGASGYVAFGTPRVETSPLPMRVFDRDVPAPTRQRLDSTIARLAAFYRQRLGPVRMPTVFVYRMPYPAGVSGNGYHGDRLPASLTLGLLGNDWNTPDISTLDLMTGFVAHELFHLWNTGDAMQVAGPVSSLASEGGAEMARIFATASVEGQGEPAWLNAATDSLDACLIALPATGSLADTDLAHGQLPYDCGVPVMLVLAAADDPHDLVKGYFRAWKSLIARQRHATGRPYHWTDLVPPGVHPRILHALHQAVYGDGSYAASMRQALTLAGFAVTPNRKPSAALRRQLNQPLMAALMATDCAGHVDLWNHPDGFLLGAHAKACRTLKAGQTVVALLGMPLASDDPAALHAAIEARCASGGKITANYASHEPAAELACPARLPASPELWRIAGPAPRRADPPPVKLVGTRRHG